MFSMSENIWCRAPNVFEDRDFHLRGHGTKNIWKRVIHYEKLMMLDLTKNIENNWWPDVARCLAGRRCLDSRKQLVTMPETFGLNRDIFSKKKEFCNVVCYSTGGSFPGKRSYFQQCITEMTNCLRLVDQMFSIGDPDVLITFWENLWKHLKIRYIFIVFQCGPIQVPFKFNTMLSWWMVKISLCISALTNCSQIFPLQTQKHLISMAKTFGLKY